MYAYPAVVGGFLLVADSRAPPPAGMAGSAPAGPAAGPGWHAGTVSAQPHTYAVRGQTEHFAGPMFSVVTDEVVMPGGEVVRRDYLRHIGAVAVVPYQDDQVVLVRQYRHPVGRPLWELPAGLADVAGESLPELAARELAEEAELVAGRLDLLLDLHPSPGCSNERIRVFLGRDLRPAPNSYDREHEEAELVVRWFPLAEALRMIFRGEITNATCVAGLLATAAARAEGWAPLRPPDTPAPSPAAGH